MNFESQADRRRETFQVTPCGTSRDERDRRRAEDALQQSEARFRILTESSSVGIWQITPQGHTIYANPCLLGMLGLKSTAQLKGKTVYQFFAEESVKVMHRHHASRSLGMMSTYEATLKSEDGLQREVLISGAPVFNANGELESEIATLTDISEMKRISQMEAQLRMADRMASVGRLAAGVAHEINNPLAHVIASLEFANEKLEFLRQQQDSYHEIASIIEEAHGSALRVAQIVRDLKLFSRPDSDEIKPVDLHKTIRSTIPLISNELRYRARLVANYGKVPLVLANDGRIGQVLLNLLVNAVQAIPEGNVSRNEIRISTYANESGCAVIEVRDSGIGMTQETMKHIFDPFFTTKSNRMGTGLGLAICYSIIKSLNGEISVESTKGIGSTFRVRLPAANIQAEEKPRDMSESETKSIARGKILVIDDEPVIGEMISNVLGKFHDVVSVQNSSEGMSEILSDNRRFDLIFCDLMMPELTGVDVYERVASVRPDLQSRFVFLTGGAFTARTQDFVSRIPNPIIEKPFRMQALRAFVEDFIGRDISQ
jgi:PAS domain S-box-containing protein